MKTIIIRLIGIIAIVIGITYFVLIIVRATLSPDSVSIPFILSALSFCILIYGGYQTVRQKAIGRKLLLIFFTCELIKIALTSLFILVSYFIFQIQSGNVEINPQPFSPISLEYLQWFYLACLLYYILSTIFFSRKSISESFAVDKSQHIKLIANILPWTAPGWGQALVGDYWKGICLFFIYYFLVTENIDYIKVDGTTSSPQSLLINHGIKFCLWAFFALIDWASVHNAVKKQNEQAASPHEDSHPNP